MLEKDSITLIELQKHNHNGLTSCFGHFAFSLSLGFFDL